MTYQVLLEGPQSYFLSNAAEKIWDSGMLPSYHPSAVEMIWDSGNPTLTPTLTPDP